MNWELWFYSSVISDVSQLMHARKRVSEIQEADMAHNRIKAEVLIETRVRPRLRGELVTVKYNANDTENVSTFVSRVSRREYW